MPVTFPSITLSTGATSASIAQPYFGYTVDIDLPLHTKRKADGHYGSWDDGEGYDKYNFTGTFHLPQAQQSALEEVVMSATRASTLTLTCLSNQGFYPFSPYKGDSGAFEVAVTGFEAMGIGEAPYKYFKTVIKLLAVDFPAYAVPADATDYGTLTIGNVSNVRFPDNWFSPKTAYNRDVAVPAEASSVSFLDKGKSGDRFDTGMQLDCSTVKLANLTNYIVGASRASALQVVAPTDSYMFGHNKTDSATYNCRLIDNTLRMKHNSFKRWTFDMMMNWESTV